MHADGSAYRKFRQIAHVSCMSSNRTCAVHHVWRPWKTGNAPRMAMDNDKTSIQT
jgi:hypothetical protein